MEPPSESDFVQENNHSRQSTEVAVPSGTATPQRKGTRDRGGESSEDEAIDAGSIQPLTPLSTISALLKSSHLHSTTTLQLYRQSQTLQRQTNER